MKKTLKVTIIVLLAFLILSILIFLKVRLSKKDISIDNEITKIESEEKKEDIGIDLIKNIEIKNEKLYVSISLDEAVFGKILNSAIANIDSEELKKSDILIASDRILVKYPVEIARIKAKADIFMKISEDKGNIRLDIDEVILANINIPEILLSLYMENILDIKSDKIKKEGRSLIVQIPENDIKLEEIEAIDDTINIVLTMEKDSLFSLANSFIADFLKLK